MPRKLEVSVEDDGHRVLFVLTPRQILQVKYMSHPGFGTRSLACLYQPMREQGTHIRVCVNLADSLMRAVFGHLTAMLAREVSLPEREEVLYPWRDVTNAKMEARKK